MKIWLPYIRAGTGTDIFTLQLSKAIESMGHKTVLSVFPHQWQYFPWRLRLVSAPSDIDIVLANSWNGFALKRPKSKLVIVEHLCVFDPAFVKYLSIPQAIFHKNLVYRFERASILAADKVIAVSRYTAEQMQKAFGSVNVDVILNGIDTDFFCSDSKERSEMAKRPIRLLFVGNLTRRKGVDMLPEIINKLGDGFELTYTVGSRDKDPFKDVSNMRSLGSLDQKQMKDAYCQADLLIFPTRLEGLPLVVMEAMSCGTPVISSNCASLPEMIDDGVTGRLCPVDDVESFVNAILELADNSNKIELMGKQAQKKARDIFCLKRMAAQYLDLFDRLLEV